MCGSGTRSKVNNCVIFVPSTVNKIETGVFSTTFLNTTSKVLPAAAVTVSGASVWGAVICAVTLVFFNLALLHTALMVNFPAGLISESVAV